MCHAGVVVLPIYLIRWNNWQENKTREEYLVRVSIFLQQWLKSFFFLKCSNKKFVRCWHRVMFCFCVNMMIAKISFALLQQDSSIDWPSRNL